jgi:predicted ATPase
MFIERLAVKGFRSLADVVWEPGKLNVLIGPNGGGKTNLLKVVRLLKASYAGQLGKFIQHEGGMSSIVWDGQATAIEIESKNLFMGDEKADYSLLLGKEGSSYFVGAEKLFIEAGFGSYPDLITRARRSASIITDNDDRKQISIKDLKPGETVLSLVGAVGASIVIHEFSADLSDSAIYGMIDLGPSRGPTVVSLEEIVAEDANNFIPVLHTAYTANRDFKNEMNAAMAAAFGSDFEELVFPPAADQRIQMRVRWKSLKREQSSADLSDGTLRFIFLVTVLANPKKPPFIAIEEPETGLHPSMLPLVADLVAEAAEQSQIVLTTHSPALIDALGKHNPTITVVESQEGKTRLKNVTVEELAHWLREFTLGEVYSSGQLENIG